MNTSKPLIYVASSLLNATEAKRVMSDIESRGGRITYDWTVLGRQTDIDSMREIAINEVLGVKLCDALLLLHPARTGSHVELGIALALDKRVVVFQPDITAEYKSFYFYPGVQLFDNLDDALAAVMEIPQCT